MSNEFPQFSEDEAVRPESPAKTKRTTVTRVRKVASPSKPKGAGSPEPKEDNILHAPVAEARLPEVDHESPPKSEPEWAEVAVESVGGGNTSAESGNKRKRRRRKGKGGASSPLSPAVESADPAESVAGVMAVAPAAPATQPMKSRMDPESLTKAAWKIYLAEVSEEGVALVGDQDARELARRCFRLAEIFLDEQARRCGK